MNTKIEDNDKKKMIAARTFFNENIMFMLNSTEMKTHIMKKTNWMFALKSKIHMIRIHFTIIIKYVIRNVISQSDQKMIITEINAQISEFMIWWKYYMLNTARKIYKIMLKQVFWL